MKIRIRKHQLINKTGQSVLVVCDGLKASYELGYVDGIWHDVTEQTSGLDEIELIMRSELSSTKASEKASTVQLSFFNDAKELIMDWLYETPCSQLNFFDVELSDETCGIIYRNFELKADNVEVCTGDGCYLSLALRESDERYEAFKKLSIMDNWQGWFSEDGTKAHPTFQVIILKSMSFLQAIPIGMLIVTQAVPGLDLILNRIAGFNADKRIRDALGLGRYSPSPRIHTILENICLKVGLTMDTVFDSGEEFYNDCFFAPSAGVYHINTAIDGSGSNSTKFIWGNRTIWQVSEFLDEICKLYNLYWDISGDTLVIKKIIDRVNGEAVDLEPYIAGDVCYTFDNSKKPAYGRYQYAVDAIDTASSDIQNAYNDIVDFDGEVDNPMLEGELNKSFRFASTGFLHDKFNTDLVSSIFDTARIIAYIIVGIISIVGGALAPIFGIGLAVIGVVAYSYISINNKVQDNKGFFGAGSAVYSGIIRVVGEGTVLMPRIIRMDAASPINNAKAVATLVSSIVPSELNTANVAYADQPWGKSLYGTLVKMWNYPLYFDGNYDGNLYDQHKATDNPYQINIGNKSIAVELPLCCDTLDLIGLQDGQQRIVGRVASISLTEKMLVNEAIVSYKEQKISLKGKIIYS